MANISNPLQETLVSAQTVSQPGTLSQQDRILIEALLVDHGVLAPGVSVTPTPSPSPSPSPTPSPTPTPGPAPTPAPTPTPTSTTVVVSPIVRLAMTTVKPGDVITAAFMNTVVEALFGLDQRLANLEAAKPQIPGPTPSASPAPTPSSTPSPTPSQTSLGTPTPTQSRSAPNLESAVATTIVGRGVGVAVVGDNIGEGLVEQILVGTTQIALKGVKFTRTGLTFMTTSAVITKGRSRLRIVTEGGEDSIAITSSKEVVR